MNYTVLTDLVAVTQYLSI